MLYRHKEKKNKVPCCNILGVNIAAINMDWLIKKDFSHVSYIPKEGKERFYFNIADKLKNDILEAEK